MPQLSKLRNRNISILLELGVKRKKNRLMVFAFVLSLEVLSVF